MIRLIKTYFQILSMLSPRLAAKQAFEVFCKVRKKDIRERERSFYDKAKREDIPYEPEPIHTYSFGNPKNETVLLVHGWDSNAGSLSKFVEPLLEKNKHVLGLNLPSHAQYENDKTTLVGCKDAMKTLLNSFEDSEITAIISHSFGSAVTGYALSELPNKTINKLFFLTSPNKIENIFTEFKDMISLGNKAYRILIERANKLLGENLEQMYIHDKLNLATFNHLHLFHDKNDKIISIKNSKLIHEKVPNSDLTTYENIGHYRMLWNDTVIEHVLDKIN